MALVTQQFLQLCKKNFTVKVRNKRASLSEFFFVVYFLAIVIFIVKANSSQLSSYPSLPALPSNAPAVLGLGLGLDLQARNLTYLYLQNLPRTSTPPQWCAALSPHAITFTITPHAQVHALHALPLRPALQRRVCLRPRRCAIHRHRSIGAVQPASCYVHPAPGSPRLPFTRKHVRDHLESKCQ
jgi:hypothetical protein